VTSPLPDLTVAARTALLNGHRSLTVAARNAWSARRDRQGQGRLPLPDGRGSLTGNRPRSLAVAARLSAAS
jgi:hypothetical protein